MTTKPTASSTLLTSAASSITTIAGAVSNDALNAQQEATLLGVIRDLEDVLYVRRKVAGASATG
jgi:hypothetical protein